jgi:proteasome lid subunit RPN8/RPN11
MRSSSAVVGRRLSPSHVVGRDLRALAHMYHLELRQFPHNFCRFNLSEEELCEIVLDAWAQGEWVDVGERKWSPHQASLTVLEGPQLPMEQLSMGRGWRNALRQCRDVTDTLLAAARARHSAAVGSSHPDVGQASSSADRRSGEWHASHRHASGLEESPDLRLAADSLGLDVLAKLGEEPAPVMVAWRIARERYPEHSASDALRLAEHAIRSLASTGLVAVLSTTASGSPEACESDEQLKEVLAAIDSWTSEGSSPAALIRRK